VLFSSIISCVLVSGQVPRAYACAPHGSEKV
jgi:hypothetical protein